LARAVTIRASRTPSGLTIRLEPGDVGHAFPTGDLFRRLRIAAFALGEPGSRTQVLLSRKSKLGAEHDERPFVDGRARDVDVPFAAISGAIRWAVFYERVAHPTSLDESTADVLASIELASGVVGPR